MPWVAPYQTLRAWVLSVGRDDLWIGRIDGESWQVLHVRRQKKRSGVDNQNSQADLLAPSIDLVGDVTAEHPGADHDDVERIAAVGADLRPRAAHPATEHVVRECRLLDIDQRVGIWVQSRQHDVPPRRGLTGCY
jgi:hypothetical protein